ncbi:hypothetical protein EZS27_022429 [termite gut metagenome]|uniref:Translocation and assembly module TamB C-terminal domain-containing protein n=1 Tax=termite gut metagenome TaxID=433724 RepID=A0A5J4R6H4_9ZZZZ
MTITKELTKMTSTEVSLGMIHIGFLLNRVTIDSIFLKDQAGENILKISRLSVKFSIRAALNKKISLSNVQLFGFDIRLNKDNLKSEPNFKFLIDVFASKDTLEKPKTDLCINSLLVRHGNISYDVWSEEETPEKFNPNHIKLCNVIGNISLKTLTNDSLNVYIKLLSFNEQSGFKLKKISLRAIGNKQDAYVENVTVNLSGTNLQIDSIHFNYDNLASFKRFVDEVHFSFKIPPTSYFTLQNFSPFVSSWMDLKEQVSIGIHASGTFNRLNCSEFQVNVKDFLKIKGNVFVKGLFSSTNSLINGNLLELSASDEGIDFLFRNVGSSGKTLVFLKRLKNISLRGSVLGSFTDFIVNGEFNTAFGNIKTDLKFFRDKEKSRIRYLSTVQSEDFDLGNFLNNKSLGCTIFKLNINGKYGASQYPDLIIKGLIGQLEYGGYKYENITLTGACKSGELNGKIELNDKNGEMMMNGSFNSKRKTPEFYIHADIKNMCPDAFIPNLKQKGARFSLKADADFSGTSVNEIEGKINIDSISFIGSEDTIFIKKCYLLATTLEKKKKLVINSDFLKGEIEGRYLYQTIPTTFINLLQGYVPALAPAKKNIAETSDFTFDLRIFNTKLLPIIFNVPLEIRNRSTLKGYFNNDTKRMRVEGHFPLFRYGNNEFESGMIFLGNLDDWMRGEIRFSTNRKGTGNINVSLITQAKNDTISTAIHWGNDTETTYSGKLSVLTSFSHSGGKKPSLKTVVDINETDIILNNILWKVYPSQIIMADSGKIHVNNFYFGHENQYVRVNGGASNNVNDTIRMDLKDINIGYIFDAFNFKNLNFDGRANGKAFLNRFSGKINMESQLFVEDFSFNKTLFGDMNIKGKWDEKERGIYVDADIKEGNISHSKATGYFYLLNLNKGLDLDIRTDNLNIYFLQPYCKSIVSNLTGRAAGKVHVFGRFKTIDCEGSLKVNAGMKINVLNTGFTFNDSIRMKSSEFLFNNVAIYDVEGHYGTIDGYLHHQNFKNISYRLNIRSLNMLVMDLKEGTNLPFYGKVYGTGGGLLTGNKQELNADIALAPTKNTNFVYMTQKVSSAANDRFIQFTDKTPRRDISDSIPDNGYDSKETSSDVNIRVNIMAEATPEAAIKIIIDPISGDFISGKGTGTLRMEYYNKSDVKMFGNYVINQGVYKFSLQDVIRKDFVIKGGSSINFNGKPLNATLDIQALYTVNSASLNDLIPENTEISRQPNTRVNCKMHLTGNLFSPDIKMDIELPNEREEVQTMVYNYLNTEEEMNIQMLYLLGIGKFYTTDNTRTQNSLMPSVFFSTLSGQFNNLLSQLMDNNNWNIGTSLSTGDKGWTDVVEIESALSGQLLDNRWLINGNFGYRNNPLATTNFVGDFETEWLITQAGDVRLKAYNQTNDRYYIRGNNLTKQGLGVVFKKDFNLWRELFVWKQKTQKK